MSRRRRVRRTTAETSIELSLSLEGSGQYDIQGLDPYTTHLLGSMVRWASMDLALVARGDLRHHVEEDVGLALGRALREATVDGAIARVGHATVPMDDALVLVAVDLSGRPFAAIDLPGGSGELHLLRSLAMEASMNLHTQVLAGEDRHHLDEATFKGLGLALGAAVAPKSGRRSTKGTVGWG